MKAEEEKNTPYTVEANNVTRFHLVDTDKLTNSESLSAFKPLYTHQIFSRMEKIVGYSGLKVDIYLTLATMKALIKVRYSKKARKRDCLEPRLTEHFGANCTLDDNIFQKWMKNDLEKFKPYGKKVFSFDQICDKHRHYEVYKVSVSNKRFPDGMNRALQALLFFYIESASFIEEDSGWNYFMLYEVVKKFKNNPPSYRLIGFSTTYEDDEAQGELARISQFLILPAYQKQGFGKSLVEGIYTHYINDKHCRKVAIEKPTKAFSNLCKTVRAGVCKNHRKAKRIASPEESYRNTKNTKIMTEDSDEEECKGRGRKKKAKKEPPKKEATKDTYKGSTLSTSSVIESEDSEWTNPFEEVKEEKPQVRGRRRSVSKKPTTMRTSHAKAQHQGIKRTAKAVRRSRRKSVTSVTNSRSQRKRAKN